MYAMFTELPAPNGGSFLPGQMNTLRMAIKKTVEKIEQYYEYTPMAVPSTHFLNQILGHYGSQYQSTAFETYRYVRSSYLNFAMALKLTAPTWSGRSFQGVFYGPGIQEVLIAHSESFDWDHATENWRDITPVEVLLHPFTNTAFNLPDGVNPTNRVGVAVIKIDFVKLIVKYRAFRLYEFSLIDGNYPDYVHKTPFQFIHMHVLPKMLKSHVDQVMVNRFKAILLDEPMELAPSRHSFYSIRHGRKIDDLLKPIIKGMDKKSLNFAQMLKYIPTIYSQDGYTLAKLTNIQRIRQTNWAWSLSRTQFLDILLGLDRKLPGSINEVYIQYLKRTYIKYENGGDIRSVVPRDLRDYWEETLGQIPEYSKSVIVS